MAFISLAAIVGRFMSFALRDWLGRIFWVLPILLRPFTLREVLNCAHNWY